jgi:hypothetical protein
MFAAIKNAPLLFLKQFTIKKQSQWHAVTTVHVARTILATTIIPEEIFFLKD